MYDQPPPTPNDLMRRLIAETEKGRHELVLIRRYLRSIEIVLGIWFVVTLPFIIVLCVMMLGWVFGIWKAIDSIGADPDLTTQCVQSCLPLGTPTIRLESDCRLGSAVSLLGHTDLMQPCGDHIA